MHVILVTNVAGPDKVGGLERYVRELAERIVGRGVRVTLVSKRLGSDFPPLETVSDGFDVVRYSGPSKANPLYAPLYPGKVAAAVARAVRGASRGGPEVIHSHFAIPATALLLMRRPFLHTFHAPVWREILPERQASYALPPVVQQAAIGAVKQVEARVLGAAGTIFVLSEYMRGEVAALNARAAERAQVLPGGMDGSRFTPGTATGEALAAGVGARLFTARRLVPRTGVLELVRAMPHVLEKLPECDLSIAGDGPLREEIEHEISLLELQGRVHLLGRITDEDLVARYRSADLVVMPTQELEGFGLTTAEALACGTPVVATPVGANAEVIGLLDPSLVSRDASAAGIAEAVVRVLSDREKLDSLRGRARAAAIPRLDWTYVVDRHLEHYEAATRAKAAV